MTTNMTNRPRVPPPSPFYQWINAVLHKEPIASMFYALYWSITLTLVWPLVQVGNAGLFVGKFGWWLIGGQERDRKTYTPANQPETEMAVVVTGCDTGFGMEVALRASKAGYKVFAGCLKRDSFQQYAVCDPSITCLLMDVTSDEQVEAAAAEVSKWLDARDNNNNNKKRVLHALVNNAGARAIGDIDWIPIKAFELCMNVNFLGTVRCCKAFLPALKKQSTGDKFYKAARIVNVTSVAGMVPSGTGRSPYSASKHASLAFTVNLRLELMAFDIAVTAINPTFHGTAMVNLVGDEAARTWNRLPEEVRKEYGESYFERFCQLSVDLPQSLMWDPEVVIEIMMNSLSVKRVPPEYVVGSDARYFIMWARQFPAWLVDTLLLSMSRRPVPDSVIRSWTNKQMQQNGKSGQKRPVSPVPSESSMAHDQ